MRQKYLNTQVKTLMPIEKHASKILTPYSFELLQEEMVLSLEYAVFDKGDGSYIIRHCDKEDGGRFVSWDASNEEVFCSCHEFEFSGILCRHAIRVLVLHNYFRLPDKYLPKRWRQENSFEIRFSQILSGNDDRESLVFRSLIKNLELECMKTKCRNELANKELEKIIFLVKGLPESEEEITEDLEASTMSHVEEDNGVKNPEQSKTKGRPRDVRLVGGIKRVKKPRRCHVPTCGGTGHDSRNCPLKKKLLRL